MMSGNLPEVKYCLGCNCIRRNFLDCNNQGGNFPAGNYPGWEFSGWELTGWQLPWVGSFRVGVILGGNFPGRTCHDESYPGWGFSRRELSWVGIFRWESAGWQFSEWKFSCYRIYYSTMFLKNLSSWLFLTEIVLIVGGFWYTLTLQLYILTGSCSGSTFCRKLGYWKKENIGFRIRGSYGGMKCCL